MAGPCTRRNASRAPSNSSNTLVPISAVFPTFTSVPAQTSFPTKAPAPTQAPAFTSAPASTLGPLGRYTDEELQRVTKLALKSFVKGQEHGQLQVKSILCKQLLKARFPDLYYGNSHLDYYCFYQQYKDYFKTARANRLNQVLFAALFLRKAIVQRWH